MNFDVSAFYGLLCPHCANKMILKHGYFYCNECNSYWDSLYYIKHLGDVKVNEIELKEVNLTKEEK